MHAASRFEFSPPVPHQGLIRAYGLALLVHGLLLAALTWGVSWRSADTSLSVEAELWSSVPQQAAPKLVEPEPTPEPAPTPPKVEEPRQSAADIALAREKERQAKEKLEREKQEHEKKLAEEKKRRERQEAAEREKQRQENIKRMLAGATGAPSATGNAQKSAGISSSYAGRIRARIKPNIVFADELATNPSAEVEVRTSPDGTIVGRKLLKSSGVPNWDEAVLKAIDKTDTLPRNEEGQVPSPMTIVFRPKD